MDICFGVVGCGGVWWIEVGRRGWGIKKAIAVGDSFAVSDNFGIDYLRIPSSFLAMIAR